MSSRESRSGCRITTRAPSSRGRLPPWGATPSRPHAIPRWLPATSSVSPLLRALSTRFNALPRSHADAPSHHGLRPHVAACPPADSAHACWLAGNGSTTHSRGRRDPGRRAHRSPRAPLKPAPIDRAASPHRHVDRLRASSDATIYVPPIPRSSSSVRAPVRPVRSRHHYSPSLRSAVTRLRLASPGIPSPPAGQPRV